MTKASDKTIELPESPASVTARIVTEHGFPVLFTLRDQSGTALMAKFEEFQKVAIQKGWKPEETRNRSFAKTDGQKTAYAQGSMISGQTTTCAKCGAPALKKSGHRKDNSEWVGIFCSTGDDNHKLWLS